MEDWSKEFWKAFESVTTEVEQFFEEVGEAVEIVAEEVSTILIEDIDQFLNDLFDPFLEIDVDFDLDIDVDESEIDPAITYKVNATPQRNPACMGCQHYHGYVYGGNLLVCGMHPSGWDGEHCPDWEQRSPGGRYDQNLF
jgi:hypothetical protein